MSDAGRALHPALSLLLRPLRALTARGGAAVGDAYARAASVVLTQYEQLEDQAAEQRYLRREGRATQLAASAQEPASGTAVAKS